MEAAKSVALEITSWAVTFCACFVALSAALGGTESAMGHVFEIPGLQVGPHARFVVAILALLVAVSAVPISNAVARALF